MFSTVCCFCRIIIKVCKSLNLLKSLFHSSFTARCCWDVISIWSVFMAAHDSLMSPPNRRHKSYVRAYIARSDQRSSAPVLRQVTDFQVELRVSSSQSVPLQVSLVCVCVCVIAARVEPPTSLRVIDGRVQRTQALPLSLPGESGATLFIRWRLCCESTTAASARLGNTFFCWSSSTKPEPRCPKP